LTPTQLRQPTFWAIGHAGSQTSHSGRKSGAQWAGGKNSTLFILFPTLFISSSVADLIRFDEVDMILTLQIRRANDVSPSEIYPHGGWPSLVPLFPCWSRARYHQPPGTPPHKGYSSTPDQTTWSSLWWGGTWDGTVMGATSHHSLAKASSDCCGT
jgi:hypothetical protein